MNFETHQEVEADWQNTMLIAEKPDVTGMVKHTSTQCNTLKVKVKDEQGIPSVQNLVLSPN